jgi:hypothetical protein
MIIYHCSIQSQENRGKSTMAKYKPYSYKQMVMLSVSLEDQIVPGTLEFAIHTFKSAWM